MNENNDKILFLFSQVMTELQSINKEIKEMNRSLAVTIERQTVSLKEISALRADVEELKKEQKSCPAKLSYKSKKQLIKDYSSVAALFLSLYAIYQILIT